MDGPGGAAEREKFPRSLRVHRGPEITEILRHGQRRRFGAVDVFWKEGRPGVSRIGVIVPKHRRSVVERNRVRRRLREIARRRLLPALVKSGRSVDVLIRARPEAYRTGFGDLVMSLDRFAEAVCSEKPSSG